MKDTNGTIRTLSLTFTHPLYARQIPQWRGAIIEMGGWENDLFHNHRGDDGYHYRYPRIHYRQHKGHAALFGINEGVDALQQVLATQDWQINWEGKPTPLQIQDLRMNEHHLRMLAQPKAYKVFNWLPFNDTNYQAWKECRNLVERVQLLERILAAHIIAFLASVEWRLPERMEISLQHIQQAKQVKFHGVPMLAFNISFTSNVLLPPGIAFGKAVSHGFGWTKPVRVRQRNERVGGTRFQKQQLRKEEEIRSED